MTRIGRIDADSFLVLSAMVRSIRVIRVLLTRSLVHHSADIPEVFDLIYLRLF